MLSRRFIASLVAASLVVCSDPVGLPVPSGLFVRERVSGVAIPAVIHGYAVYSYITVAWRASIGFCAVMKATGTFDTHLLVGSYTIDVGLGGST